MPGATGSEGPQGPAGADGTDALWNFSGEYDNGADYNIGDVVTYNGGTYYRILGPNLGYAPGTEYWTTIAEPGEDGQDGVGGNSEALDLKADLLEDGFVDPRQLSKISRPANLFVAVSQYSQNAAYSTDGINWTETTMPTSSNWRSVAYGDEKFVAVARYSDTAVYSEDGITWTTTIMPTSSNWRSVTYGNDKFVAVAGYSSSAAYSTDGITWTDSSLPTSSSWQSVTYGDDKFVAVASYSDTAAYSLDGITWTTTIVPTSSGWRSVTYGNDKFVAVASYSSSAAAYSEDGITWTETTMLTSSNWRSVAYGNDKFVAISESMMVSSKLAYSEDGITWTETVLPANTYLSKVAYFDGKFIATGSSLSYIYSTDGIEWTDSQLTGSGSWTVSGGVVPNVQDIASVNMIEKKADLLEDGFVDPGQLDSIGKDVDLFVAVRSGTNQALISSDAVNWDVASLPQTSTWNSIAHGDEKFVICSRDSQTAYSIDAVNWTVTSYTNGGEDIAYGDGRFVTTDGSYSEDGVHWNKTQGAYGDTIAYGNGTFVILRASDGVFSTNGGVSWSSCSGLGFRVWRSVAYGNGRFIAAGVFQNRSAYSEDGITWTEFVGPYGSADLVFYADGKFFVSGNWQFGSFSSVDGITWTANSLPTGQRLAGYAKEKLVTMDYSWSYSSEDNGQTWTQTLLPNISGGNPGGNIVYGFKENIHRIASEKDLNDLSLSKADILEDGFVNPAQLNKIDRPEESFLAVDGSRGKVLASPDGISWTESDIPINGTSYVAYGSGNFVAVSSFSSLAFVSNNGIGWTPVRVPVIDSWESRIAYGNGKFVFVKRYSETSAYSEDGTAWTQTTIPYGNWNSVTYGNDKFVVVPSYSDLALYSTDGITWTQTTMPTSSNWSSVAYGNGKFFAVSSGSIAAYSADGITWTETSMPTESGWASVTYGNGKFVAVSGGSIAAYSADGITWTETSMPTESGGMSYGSDQVTYGNNKFVAVGRSSQTAAYSTDGITWTRSAVPYGNWTSVTTGLASYFYSIASESDLESLEALKPDVEALKLEVSSKADLLEDGFVDPRQLDEIGRPIDIFVAVASYSDTVAYSEDGISWTVQEFSLPSSGERYSSVAYGVGKFIAVSDYSSTAAVSEDGLSWTSRSLPFTSSSWESRIHYGKGKFIAVKSYSSIVLYSEDGVTWATATLPEGPRWRGIANSNEKFVLVSSYSSVAAYSEDGITWTETAMPASRQWRSVAYGGGKFIAVSSYGTAVALSEDGIIWTDQAVPNANFRSITYGNNKFVAVGPSSVSHSEDGIIWTDASTTLGTQVSVAYRNGKFVSVGQYSSPIYSENGTSWISGTDLPPGRWNAVAGGVGSVYSKIASEEYVNTQISNLPTSNVLLKTSNYEITPADNSSTILCDGAFTLSFGQLDGEPAVFSAGNKVDIINTGTGTITLLGKNVSINSAQPDLSAARALFSAGPGLDYNATTGQFSAGVGFGIVIDESGNLAVDQNAYPNPVSNPEGGGSEEGDGPSHSDPNAGGSDPNTGGSDPNAGDPNTGGSGGSEGSVPGYVASNASITGQWKKVTLFFISSTSAVLV